MASKIIGDFLDYFLPCYKSLPLHEEDNEISADFDINLGTFFIQKVEVTMSDKVIKGSYFTPEIEPLKIERVVEDEYCLSEDEDIEKLYYWFIDDCFYYFENYNAKKIKVERCKKEYFDASEIPENCYNDVVDNLKMLTMDDHKMLPKINKQEFAKYIYEVLYNNEKSSYRVEYITSSDKVSIHVSITDKQILGSYFSPQVIGHKKKRRSQDELLRDKIKNEQMAVKQRKKYKKQLKKLIEEHKKTCEDQIKYISEAVENGTLTKKLKEYWKNKPIQTLKNITQFKIKYGFVLNKKTGMYNIVDETPQNKKTTKMRTKKSEATKTKTRYCESCKKSVQYKNWARHCKGKKHLKNNN